MRKASVIITNYCYGKFLEETIESVLNQSYPEWECILVDDGSTDNSREIIEKYCAAYPEKFRSVFKANGGQYSAFYEGFKISSGDIICTLDSDDLYFPEMLKRKMEMHDKFPDAGLCDTAITADNEHPYTNKRSDLDYHDLYVNYGYLFPHGTTSSLSFSREVLEKILPLEGGEKFRGGLDLILTRMVCAAAPVIVDNRVSGYYRIHDYHVTKEHYEWNNSHEYLMNMWKEIDNFVYRKFRERGVAVPENDDKYYDKIISDQIEALRNSRCVIYGSSSVTHKIVQVMERKNIKIVFCTDNPKFRRVFSDEYRYKMIPATELRKCRADFDIIIVASRASAAISEYLRGLGMEDNIIITFPI